MAKIFVLDIGSGNLTFIAGSKSDAGVYCVDHFASCEYDGYYKSEFLDKDALADSIKDVIAASGYRGSIGNLYIGVPTDFTKLMNTTVSDRFRSLRTITEGVLDSLYSSGNIFDNDKNYEVIACSPQGFELDDGVRTKNPIGELTSSVSASVSYILCDREFCRLMQEIAHSAGVKRVSFIPSFWATCAQLLSPDAREQGAAVCDIGFSNTSFGVAVGDGMSVMQSVSIGGGNVSGDLMQVLGLPYASACALADKANLFIDSDNGSCYNVVVDGKPQQFNSFATNRIITARLDDFVSFVRVSLEYNEKADREVLYLTGGGITSLKGATAYLSRQLGMRIEVVVPDVPTYGKPWFSSAFATFDAADKLEKSKNILERLLDKFRR